MPQKRRSPPRRAHSETIGQRLARLRREQGLSQGQLAKRLGVTQSNVSEYEHDRVRLHSDVIVLLAQVLKVSADELLGLQAPSRRVPVTDRRFLAELSLIDHLPRRDKDALLRTIRLYTAKARTDTSQSSRAAAK